MVVVVVVVSLGYTLVIVLVVELHDTSTVIVLITVEVIVASGARGARVCKMCPGIVGREVMVDGARAAMEGPITVEKNGGSSKSGNSGTSSGTDGASSPYSSPPASLSGNDGSSSSKSDGISSLSSWSKEGSSLPASCSGRGKSVTSGGPMMMLVTVSSTSQHPVSSQQMTFSPTDLQKAGGRGIPEGIPEGKWG